MANDTLLIGTLVGGPVVPDDPADTYPTHDARLGKGGFRVVDDLVDRNAIPIDRLRQGMWVKVLNDSGNIYELSDLYNFLAPTIDADWSLVTFSGSTVQTDFYVDPDTGSDLNTGGPGDPFETCATGFSSCLTSLEQVPEVNLNLIGRAAAALYSSLQSEVDLTSDISGIINVTGDPFAPANVGLQSTAILGGTVIWKFDCPNLWVEVDGIRFTNATYAIRNVSSKIRWKNATTDEIAASVQNDTQEASLYYVNNINGDAIIAGPIVGTAGTYGIRNLNGAYLEIDQGIDISSVNFGILNEGVLYAKTTNNIDITTLSLAGAYCLQDTPNAYTEIESSIDLDGTAPQVLLSDANSGFIFSGTVRFPFSANYNFDNLRAGVYLKAGCRLYDSGNTWLYTNVTTDCVFENGVLAKTTGGFDASTTIYFGDSSFLDGSNFEQENFSRMVR